MGRALLRSRDDAITDDREVRAGDLPMRAFPLGARRDRPRVRRRDPLDRRARRRLLDHVRLSHVRGGAPARRRGAPRRDLARVDRVHVRTPARGTRRRIVPPVRRLRRVPLVHRCTSRRARDVETIAPIRDAHVRDAKGEEPKKQRANQMPSREGQAVAANPYATLSVGCAGNSLAGIRLRVAIERPIFQTVPPRTPGAQVAPDSSRVDAGELAELAEDAAPGARPAFP